MDKRCLSKTGLPSDNKWLVTGLIGIVLLLTAYRTWIVISNGLPLYVDEAQYWYWAQNLDWGYYSKPPIIAVLIAATTSVCGDTEFCVRSGSLIMYPLSSLAMFFLARYLFDTRVALVAVLIFITLPAVGLSSTLISTDVALFFFWILALYLFVRVLDSDSWSDWLMLGITLGLGMMSKYTMGVFFVSALTYLLFCGRWRYLLKVRAWVAVLIATAVFAPNLWWNWQHNFPTFQHTAEISDLEQAGLHWGQLAEFLGGQLLVFGLLFFPLLVWIVFCPSSRRTLSQSGLLLSFALPFLFIICLQALLGRANANWAAPAYVAGTLLLAAWLVRCQHGRLFWVGMALNCALWAGLYHYGAIARVPGVELTAKNDVYKRLRGWDEIGLQFKVLLDQYPDAVPMARERGVLSELAYYARPRGLEMVSWNPDGLLRHHYDLVTAVQGQGGQDFLYVADNGLPDGMASFFQQVDKVGLLLKEVYPGYRLEYDVYHLKNYKREID